MNDLILNVDKDDAGKRLDKYITEQNQTYSRSFLQRLIKQDCVQVNGKTVKTNYKVKQNDSIICRIPPPRALDIKAEDIPLDIVYEDKDIIIVNKPQGMVVHPANGHYEGTLVNALLYHCQDSLSGINGILRPGIVHRIDKDTSGLLVVCKNDFAHINIAQQLKDHTITRKYLALVYNNIKENEGTVDAPIGRHPIHRKKMAINRKNGKRAVTHYRVLEHINSQYTLVELQLETGRTHQIRVHMSSIHHPLLGDPVYGINKDKFHLEGQMLHAKILGFIHPTNRQYMQFEAPLPDYFRKLLNTWNINLNDR